MRKLIIRVSLLLLTTLLMAGVSFSQQRTTSPPKAKKPPSPPQYPDTMAELRHKNMRPPSGTGFYIDALGTDLSNFSLLLSDENNRTVAGTFRRPQVEIFEALMVEAKKFAETDEAAGLPGSPKTTRFMDKDEKSFVIDVQKKGLESRFFITLKTLQGTLTVDAGAIRRGNKKDQPPLFFSALDRLRLAKDGEPPPK